MTEVILFEITCAECGISFWVTNSLDEQLRKTHRTFYCINGHKQFYKK